MAQKESDLIRMMNRRNFLAITGVGIAAVTLNSRSTMGLWKDGTVFATADPSASTVAASPIPEGCPDATIHPPQGR